MNIGRKGRTPSRLQVARRKLGRIVWNVKMLRWKFNALVQRLENFLKRKKGCEHWDNPECFCSGEVALCHAATAYQYTGTKNGPDDPNRDFYACDAHAEVYYRHWKEMWDEYYWNIRN